MSATMARQGGRVQLEQSNMSLALNMAKMAKGRFLRTKIGEMQYLMKKPRAEVWEEKKWGVECLGHKKLKAAIERHMAMLCQNQTDGCLSWENGTAKNPQTRWRQKGTGASTPERCRQTTPEPMPPLPQMPPQPAMPAAPPCNKAGAPHSQIVNVLAGYVYSHSSLPCAELFTLH